MADQKKIANALTQAQVDAEAIYARAAAIDPYQAALIKENAKGNLMSPRVIASLSALGVDAKSGVAASIENINASTRDARLADQKKLAQDREREDFDNSNLGKVWRLAKTGSRFAMTTFGSTWSWMNGQARQGFEGLSQAARSFGIASAAKPLGVTTGKPEKYIPSAFEQTTLGQALIEAKKDVLERKQFPTFETGNGFFPSEETGLGHAARQASLSAAKIAIKDSKGKTIGYRPANLLGDTYASIFTLGHPESQAGSIISLAADIAGSFAFDPGLARASELKALRKLAAQERAAGAVDVAAKTEQRIRELERLENEAVAAAKAARLQADNLKKLDIDSAKQTVLDSRAAWSGKNEDAIKASQGVRRAQAQLDEFKKIEEQELLNLASAKEARLAAEAAFKAPKQVERGEKLLAKQRKQLEEMTAQREEALSRGLVPMRTEDEINALTDAIKATEQNLIDTKALTQVEVGGEDLVRSLNPQMYNTSYVEQVDVNFLKKFIEFDRTKPEFNKAGSLDTISKIVDDLKAGKGFTDPLLLDYWVDANGKLMLNLTEGNHRIQAALEAGLDSVPVRVLKGYESRLDQAKTTEFASKILPDESGYLPGTLAPSKILPEEALVGTRVTPKDVVTQEALAAAKELEKTAVRRLKEVKGEIAYVSKRVAERSNTQRIVERAREGAARDTLKAKKQEATLSEKMMDATLSLKDKRKSWELAVKRLADVEQNFQRPEFAYQKIAEFLTNGHGTKAVDRLVEITDWKSLWRKADGRLTADQAKALANATTPDEVVDVLAPYIKSGDLAPGALEPSVLARRGEKIAERTKFLVPMARTLKGVGAATARRMPHYQKVAQLSGALIAKPSKKVASTAQRLYKTKVKNGVMLNIHDREELLRSVEDFANAANLPKDVLDNLIDEIADAASDSVAGYTASVKLLDAVFNNYAGKLPKHLQDSFKQYTTAFKESSDKMSSYWATRHAQGAHMTYMTLKGEKVVLPGPHLDSEMLNSTIYLPPVGQLLKMTNRLSKYPTTTAMRDAADKVIGEWWKKSVLVRPAYIVRNIAEEQIRVAAVGHASFFTRPGMALAMWLGKEDGPWTRRLLKQFDTYSNTVFDESFTTGDEALDILDETLGHGLKNSYIDLMNSARGAADERDFRALSFKSVRDVAYGHPRFFDGATNQLRMLNSSAPARVVAGYDPKFVKDAMAKGQFREEAVVDYFLTGPGRREWDRFLEGTGDEFKAFGRTPEGVKAYLYNGKNAAGEDISLLARINETTGGNSLLKELVAKGKVNAGGVDLVIPRPSREAINSIQNSKAVREGKKALLDEQAILAEKIKNIFGKTGNWQNARFNVPSKVVANVEGTADKFGIADRFFEIATNFEKNTTFGPEFRQAYWDAINVVAKALDSNAKTQLLKTAENSLTPLQKAGINIGEKHPVWNAFRAADGKGKMTLEDAHAYADNYARKHVKELFYNAHEKRLIFHQLRLIAPFAAAWENTITKWAELGLENPVGVYKAMKGLEWATKQESSAIYQLTDAEDYYDPNQGFFFTNPESGQRQFFVPFSGTVMAWAAKKFTGANYNGSPIAFTANPMSFNFAFGTGTMLPGVGPGITIPLSALATFDGNYIDAMPMAIQKWLFPFGRVDFSSGIQSAVLPGNWNKILGGFTGMENSYASNFKPIMNYLASGANYNLDDPEDQAQLLKDTDTFARWESIMRGVIGLFSPMSLQQQGLAKDKDGDITLQFTLMEDFHTMLENNDGDYNKAWYDFLNTYGASQAFAIISSSAGNGPSNWDSYQFVVDNPDVATRYKDVWGYVMPGGGLSTEMYKWNVVHDTKKRLSSKEILEKVNNQRYYAVRDALMTRVDSGEFDKNQYSDALSAVKQTMGGGPVTEFDPNKRGKIIRQLNELIGDERFADIPSVAALRNYMAIRQQILTTLGKKEFTGAQNEQSARDFLAAQAEWIVKDYPDFQKMFYGFFANELEGK